MSVGSNNKFHNKQSVRPVSKARSAGDNPVQVPGSGPGFIHLHVHSAYSLLEGAIQTKRLQELAITDGQPALAITDRNNLFGALEFSQNAAAKGLQPIMGCMLAVDFSTGLDVIAGNGDRNQTEAVEDIAGS